MNEHKTGNPAESTPGERKDQEKITHPAGPLPHEGESPGNGSAHAARHDRLPGSVSETLAASGPDHPPGPDARQTSVDERVPSMPPSLLEQSGSDEPGDNPVSYAEFAVPEGFTVDEELMGAFREEARTMNLSQEQAQRLVDLQARVEQSKQRAWHGQIADWNRQIEADPEYGGRHLATTIADANAALSAYDAGGELRGTLIGEGFEHNPALLRFLANAGRALRREGDVIKGKAPAPVKQKSVAEKLWPDWKV